MSTASQMHCLLLSKHLLFNYLFHVTDILSACIYLYHVHAWYSRQPAEVIVLSGTRVTNGYDLPYGFWESNLNPLVLLTTESTHQFYLFLSRKYRFVRFFPPGEEVRAFCQFALTYY